MIRFICFAVLYLSLTSCLNKNSAANNCTSTRLTSTLTATGPKTVAVNQPAVFTLGYNMVGACGTLDNIAEQVAGNVRYVGVNVRYEGCDCPTATVPAQATYTFQPTQAGTYYLQFVTGTGYLKDTLVVK